MRSLGQASSLTAAPRFKTDCSNNKIRSKACALQRQNALLHFLRLAQRFTLHAFSAFLFSPFPYSLIREIYFRAIILYSLTALTDMPTLCSLMLRPVDIIRFSLLITCRSTGTSLYTSYLVGAFLRQVKSHCFILRSYYNCPLRYSLAIN